jgi:hypothetical protein
MLARLLALLVALATGVTGILPAGDGYRCLIMNQRMSDGAPCCHKPEAPSLAIGAPCCEAVAGAKLDARAPHTVEQPQLQPAPLVAILPLAMTAVADLGQTARNLGSLFRGQPPGEQLRQLSQVLRI